MLMHVAGTFPDNYIYGKCTYYIWEYGEIGENNTYLRTDHAPQVYIPCSSLVQYSLNCSLIYSLLNKHSTSRTQLLAIKGTLASPHCCCPSFVATPLSKHGILTLPLQGRHCLFRMACIVVYVRSTALPLPSTGLSPSTISWSAGTSSSSYPSPLSPYMPSLSLSSG